MQKCHCPIICFFYNNMLFCVFPVCYDVRLSHLNKAYLLSYLIVSSNSNHIISNVIRQLETSQLPASSLSTRLFSFRQTLISSERHILLRRPFAISSHRPKRNHIQISIFVIIIHADHVVQSAWILFSLWMYVCMYVSALERKRLIGMT